MTGILPIDKRKEKGDLYAVENDHCYAKVLRDKDTTSRYVCVTCRETFPTKEALNKHTNLHRLLENVPENTKLLIVVKKLHRQPDGNTVYTNLKNSNTINTNLKNSNTVNTNLKNAEKQDDTLKKDEKKKSRLYKKAACDECHKLCGTNAALGSHKRWAHTSTNKIHKCLKCSRCFNRISTLNTHNIIVHNAFHPDQKRFKCDTCEASFPRKFLLIKHIQMHKGILKYKCEECHRGYGGLSALTFHKIAAHGKQSRNLKKEKTIKCLKCWKYFKSEARFKYHTTVVHSNGFKCDVCGETFKTTKMYTAHIRIHKFNLEFECKLCPLRFKRRSDLSYHKNHKHQDVQGTALEKHGSLQCSHCGIVFDSIKKLEKHEKLDHVDHENYEKCRECGKKFKSKKYLNSHKKIMHGIADKKCIDCDATFSTLTALNRHKKVHDKKFLCSYCGRGFTDTNKLKVHEYSHTNKEDLTCNICNKVYGLVYFKVHMQMHRGIKSFECNHCGKIFGSSAGLKYHTDVKKCGQS